MGLAEYTGCKNSPKIPHLRTIAQLCRAISSQLRHVSTIGQQYLLHMFSQYGELRPTSGWDRLAGLGHPSKFQRVLRYRLRYCTDVVQWRSTKLRTMFGSLLGWYTIYTLPATLALTEFYQVQNSLCIHVLRSPILAALMHGTRAVCVSQTLRRSVEGGTYIRYGGHHVGHQPTF